MPPLRLLHFVFVLLLLSRCAVAKPVPAVHKQGAMHGFLTLRAGTKLIGTGEQVTLTTGSEVRSRLTFHFLDGSLDDETTVFRQGPALQLVSDHHVQKGPSFPDQMDVAFDVATGEVTTRGLKDGKLEAKTEHMDLPADLVNGMVSSFLQNYPRNAPEMKASYLAASPKPRVVHLAITPENKQPFRVGSLHRSATIYRIHIELGGVAGVVAPVLGKQPGDIRVWIMTAEVPTFIKMEGAFFVGGPIWTAAITVPVLPDDGR